MYRSTNILALAAALSLPVALGAQSGDAVIQKEGASPVATAITFPVARGLTYKLAWGVNAGPDTPDAIVAGLKKPANFLFLADKNGLPRTNIQLAVVIWGNATYSLLRNDAYKAAKGADNASIALLEALNEAGVQVIVCGEALINRKLDRADLLPFVKIAPTASMALATLHAQGYATWAP